MNPTLIISGVTHDRSHNDCPACGKKLWRETNQSGVTLFCCHVPCRSIAAWDGATGLTDDAAFDELLNNVQRERHIEETTMTDDEARDFLRSCALFLEELK